MCALAGVGCASLLRGRWYWRGFSGGGQGVPDLERVDRPGHVVDADDGSALVDGRKRRGDACELALADGTPGELAQRRFARPAKQQGAAQRAQLCLADGKRDIVRRALAEADTRIEHNAV